jgi:hypothetical protein
MRSHILLHRATTKYFSNSFVFKTEIERKDFQEIVRTPGLGAGGPEFKSRRPEHFMFIVFHRLETVSLLLWPSVNFS